jgi:hypothetical protein
MPSGPPQLSQFMKSLGTQWAPAAIRDTAMAAIQMNACSSRIQGFNFGLLIAPSPFRLSLHCRRVRILELRQSQAF